MELKVLKSALPLACLLMMGPAQPAPAETASPGLQDTNAPAGFSGPAEALAMMLQVVGNLKAKVDNKDLLSIHTEDLVLSASVQAVLQQAIRIALADRQQFTTAVTNFAEHVAALHFAGDTRQQTVAEKEMAEINQQFDRIQSYFSAAARKAAEAMASKYSCPTHSEVQGKRTDHCSKCGSLLERQVRVMPAFCGLFLPEKQSIHALIRTDKPLAVGQPVTGLLQLSRSDGSPVYASELIPTHTEKIHLFIVDPSLSDYHHEHPRPSRMAGQYTFPFTARKPGNYRAWVDVRPEPMGLQEFVPTTIAGTSMAEPLTDRTSTKKVTIDGFTYELVFTGDSVRVGKAIAGRLRVSDSAGTPFAQLEPVMDSFAHFVGFYEDGATVLHIHPKGPAVLNRGERGGPELEFQLYTLKPGFVRLFAQVQIAGVSKVAPFGVEVEP